MPEVSLTPIAGINNTALDDDMVSDGDSPVRYVREALNINIHKNGTFSMRGGLRKVSDSPLRDVWQSRLHGDVFGVDKQNRICVLNASDFSVEKIITEDVTASDVYYDILNNTVIMATGAGLFQYKGGDKAERLGIDTPYAPILSASSGSLQAGNYGIAVSWVRYDGIEGAVSEMSDIEIDSGGIDVYLPICFDKAVTKARVYMTNPNGGELLEVGDFDVSGAVSIVSMPKLGRAAEFRYLTAMPAGKYLKYWKGRIMTAQANELRFSKPLAYHLHDERFDYVKMPQRITFVEPVDGGIFVGQVDHVAFLRGVDIDSFEMVRIHSKPPVHGSSVAIDADEAVQLSNGLAACVWLADNGYVGGMADGSIAEIHSGVLSKISFTGTGRSCIHGRRVITLAR